MQLTNYFICCTSRSFLDSGKYGRKYLRWIMEYMEISQSVKWGNNMPLVSWKIIFSRLFRKPAKRESRNDDVL